MLVHELLLIAGIALAAPGAAPIAGMEPARAEERALELKAVSAQIVCQCGCNMILSECSHQSCPFALPERDKILAAIDDGKPGDDIVAGYVESYGRSILSSPPTRGTLLDRAAYVAPYLVLVLGAGIVVRVVRGFVRKPAPAGVAGVGTAARSEDPYRRAIEDELAAGDGEALR